MARKDEAKMVKEIVRKYGETIDLKTSPYVIVEIIRKYGQGLGLPAADCQPPGGTKPPKFDPSDLTRELNARLADVTRISKLLQKSVDGASAPPAKRAAKRTVNRPE